LYITVFRVGQSLISANCKRAIERFVAHSLIAKERSLAQSLFQKERKSKNEQKMSDFPNRSFFAKKKRAIAHFQNEQILNPLTSPLI